jgi:site-specific DNA-cytosine methylase
MQPKAVDLFAGAGGFRTTAETVIDKAINVIVAERIKFLLDKQKGSI